MEAHTTMFLIKHNGYYHARYKTGDTYRTVSTHTRIRREALTFLPSFEPSTSGKMTVADLAREFLEHS